MRRAEEGPVGGANSLSLSPRGPLGGLTSRLRGGLLSLTGLASLRRGGDRSLSRSRKFSRGALLVSRSRNGDLGADAGSRAGLSSTRAALLGWTVGRGEDRREVAADWTPEASLEVYAGLAEGDLRLRHVSAVYGSGRSRLGEGERRRKSRLSRGGGEVRRGLFELALSSAFSDQSCIPINTRARLLVAA